jgi:hypothetical protein
VMAVRYAVILDLTPCGSYKNQRLGGTSVLTRPTRRDIPEDGILQGNIISLLRCRCKLQTVYNTNNFVGVKLKINYIWEYRTERVEHRCYRQ